MPHLQPSDAVVLFCFWQGCEAAGVDLNPVFNWNTMIWLGFFSLYNSSTHTIQLLDEYATGHWCKAHCFILSQQMWYCTQQPKDVRSFKLPPSDWTSWISLATGLISPPHPLMHPKTTEYVMKSHPSCTYLNLVFHILYVISQFFIQRFTFEQHEKATPSSLQKPAGNSTSCIIYIVNCSWNDISFHVRHVIYII